MKILEKRVKVLYRFKCNKCGSMYEMTEDERTENDWEHGDHKKGDRWNFPSNTTNRFYCPVCDTVRYMEYNSIHRYSVMDNGKYLYEVRDY